MRGRAPRTGAGATTAVRALTMNSQATLPQMNPCGGTREPVETGTTAEGGGDPTDMGNLLSAGPWSRSRHLLTAPKLAT
jgi:hypothetical protein